MLVYFFGKKDQKLEETKRLQKIELDAFKKVEEKPEKVEVTKEEVKENVPEVSNEVTVTEFVPEEKEESEEIELPQVKEEVKPIFKDTDEEKNPISIDELPKEEVKPIFDNNEEDKKLENDLNSLESIKNEFDKIEIPEVKDEPLIKEEASEKVFKPSPQIFSSVYVNKNEESVTKVNDEVVRSKDNDEVRMSIPEVNEEEVSNKLFTIEDDDDIELPTLKSDDKPILSDNLGETYELK